MNEPVYEGIAIVGMEGRFPGAENVDALWANLVAGRETVSFSTMRNCQPPDWIRWNYVPGAIM